MAKQSDPKSSIEARRKYAAQFNKTLIDIWEERIIKLNAIARVHDPGDKMPRLLNSLGYQPFKADPEFSELTFHQEFRHYGIFIDAGTGRGVFRGNKGDIGRQNLRRPRPWFYPKYYMSYRNILEFLAESFGEQAMAVITNALEPEELRKQFYENNSDS